MTRRETKVSLGMAFPFREYRGEIVISPSLLLITEDLLYLFSCLFPSCRTARISLILSSGFPCSLATLRASSAWVSDSPSVLQGPFPRHHHVSLSLPMPPILGLFRAVPGSVAVL